jgi:hypothetical protein
MSGQHVTVDSHVILTNCNVISQKLTACIIEWLSVLCMWPQTCLWRYTVHPSIHPMALQPKSVLGLLCLLSPQCSIISGQLPVATAQKAGTILLHRIFTSFPGLSNRSYCFKRTFKHFVRNSCAFRPLDMPRPLKPFQFDTWRYTVPLAYSLPKSKMWVYVWYNRQSRTYV